MRISHWTFASSLAALVGLALPATAKPKGSASHEHAAAAAHGAKPEAKAHASKGEAHEAKEAHEKGKEAKEAHANKPDQAGDKGKDEQGNKGKDEQGDKGKDEQGNKGPPEAVQKKLEQLRATRKQRRAAHIAKLKHEWGALLDRPAVRAELKVHAWRMARLDRIRELASAENKTDIVARVDKLIAKEQQRHEKHMGVLKKQGGKK